MHAVPKEMRDHAPKQKTFDFFDELLCHVRARFMRK
jgi:hypothetical protein